MSEEGKKILDSSGKEIEVGDIIECKGVPFPDHAERYHVAFLEWGKLSIRDLRQQNENPRTAE